VPVLVRSEIVKVCEHEHSSNEHQSSFVLILERRKPVFKIRF